MSKSISAFCSDIGLPLRNERWSWSAVNEERRQAIFTIWDDRLELPARRAIDLSWLNDPIRTELGAKEFRRVMGRVLEDGFAAYGILCEAVDPEGHPRKRKRFERDLLVLDVALEGGRTIARIVGMIDAETLRANGSVADFFARRRSTLDDLEDSVIADILPTRMNGETTFFIRDDKVRSRVVSRSGGICEYCGALGFIKPDGQRYVETHHIISLAKQGPDTFDNVIALCANDHRAAHYGADRDNLEQAFLAKLAILRGRAR